jgi:integrase
MPVTSQSFAAIKPAIGNVGLADLKARDLRQMYRCMIEGGLSSTTANQAHRVLSAAFAIAVREREIDFNPCLTLDAPRTARPHLEALTVAESRTLLAHLRTRSDGALWATYLLTGARRGEVLGLERDRVTTTLELSWQLQTFTVGRSPERLRKPDGFESRHLSGRFFLTRPKSAAGIRVVPLVEPLRSILDDYMRHNQRAVGDLLFAERGHPYDPDSVGRRWRGVLADAGIEKDVRLHGLRHTALDLMLEAGVPMDVIKEIVGHSSRAMSEAYKSRGNDPRLRDAMPEMAAVIG